MKHSDRAVILVGHGSPPRDFPRAEITRLKALEGRRQATSGPMSEEERALDERIRRHPRTADNDPYREGLTALADALRPKLEGAPLLLAYNEFCAPTLAEAVATAITSGASIITVVPSMLTPGGVHSEVEIPEALAALRLLHPTVTLRYAWPFDLDRVAAMLADHVTAAEALGAPGVEGTSTSASADTKAIAPADAKAASGPSRA